LTVRAESGLTDANAIPVAESSAKWARQSLPTLEKFLTRKLATPSGPSLPPLRGEPPPPDQNPVAAYLASLASSRSRRTQASAARQVAAAFGHTPETLPWGSLRAVHTFALRTYFVDRKLAPKTATRYLTALREVMRWAWRFGQISREELERAIDIDPITGSREAPGRALTVGEIEKLYDTAKRDVRRRRGARDGAIFTLLYAGGLRRFEVAEADLKAYTGRSVRVVGKGNKEREIPLNESARKAMDRWLEVRGRGPGPLITSLESPFAGISPDAVGDAMHRLAKRAGVDDFTTHDGRRTKATNLDEAGADLEDIQHALGHAHLATTLAYRRRRLQAERRERTARLLPVPYS